MLDYLPLSLYHSIENFKGNVMKLQQIKMH